MHAKIHESQDFSLALVTVHEMMKQNYFMSLSLCSSQNSGLNGPEWLGEALNERFLNIYISITVNPIDFIFCLPARSVS